MKTLFIIFSLFAASLFSAVPVPQEALKRAIAATGISNAPPIVSPVNVQWFGAKGDGVTNDTAAIQAAMDSMQSGTLFFPAGTYIFSSLSFVGNDKQITLRGEGYQNTANDPFGNSNWNYPKVKGTVLRSTASSGNAILLSTILACNVCDMAIVGPGSGTAIGVKLTSPIGACGLAVWTNVMIANFAQGIAGDALYDSQFNSLNVLGCTLGMKVTNASNQNVMINCQFQSFTSKGLWINDSTLWCIYGGLFQAYQGSAIYVDGAGGASLHLSGAWFESTHANSNAVDIEGGDFHTIENCRFSSVAGNNNADVIRVNGGTQIHFRGNRVFNDARIVGTGGLCVLHDLGMPVDSAYTPYVSTSASSDGVTTSAKTNNGGTSGRVETVTGDATPIMTRRFYSPLNANSDWIQGLATDPAYAYGDGALFWRNSVTGIPFIMAKDGTFTATKFAFSGTDAKIYTGTGSPETVVTAYEGALFLRSDGGAGTTLYVKESGNNTNTGWVGK